MAGLVLEGGAMRGLYTAGVLDALIFNEIDFQRIYAVSAGATAGVNYVSRQKGRSLAVAQKFCSTTRYWSHLNLLRCGNMMDIKFMFEDVPNRLMPFDYKAFTENSCEMYIGVTNARTGQAEFFEKRCLDRRNNLLKATCALPHLFPPVDFAGNMYFDGGIACPIPIEKSISAGNENNLIVLTRPLGVQKIVTGADARIYMSLRRKYPVFAGVFLNRAFTYNSQIELCQKLQAEGRAVIIAPKNIDGFHSFERNPQTLYKLYRNGYDDTNAMIKQIRDLL